MQKCWMTFLLGKLWNEKQGFGKSYSEQLVHCYFGACLLWMLSSCASLQGSISWPSTTRECKIPFLLFPELTARMKTGSPATVKWVSVPLSANSPFRNKRERERQRNGEWFSGEDGGRVCMQKCSSLKCLPKVTYPTASLLGFWYSLCLS